MTRDPETSTDIAECVYDGFRERAPWWGGDLQTLRNYLMLRQSKLPGLSFPRTFPVSDGSGDRLTGTLHRPSERGRGPLIMLLHGLTGSEDSSYMRETARFHLQRRRRVLRLNLRGAGSSRHLASRYYHAGCAPDLEDVLRALEPGERANGVFAVGFSLGGNILLNLLGRHATGHGLVGAATVSAPIEPFQSSQRMMAPRNVLYHAYILRRMKQEVLSCAELSRRERRNIQQASSVYEFDDRYVAPRNGFVDARDYYAKTAGARQVHAIAVPTLMLHARNDPWIPVSPYRALQPGCPAHVSIVIARSGGHVGFHEHGSTDTWHDRQIDAFLHGIKAV